MLCAVYIFIMSVHAVYVILYVGCGMHNLLVVYLTYTCDVCACVLYVCVYMRYVVGICGVCGICEQCVCVCVCVSFTLPVFHIWLF